MLWTFSTLDRVRKCRHTTQGGTASIVKREAHAHFAGLQTCGSVWSCPVCSERILAARADELVRAIEAWIAQGGRVALLTLTMRHSSGDELVELWDALSPAWAAAVGGHRSARAAMDAAGVAHWVRRTECTVGANGWHLHPHALLFLPGDATDASVRELGEAMFGAWAKRLSGLGLDAPLRDSGGLDIKLLELDQAREDVAGYLAKGTYEASTQADRATSSERAARELASNGGKLARRGNRSTMQLLADVVALGEATDLELWRTWERGSHNRRAMTWSKGARLALVDELDERTDEEIAAANEGVGELVVELTADEWAAIRSVRRLPTRLLEWVEDADDAPDARWLIARELARHGLPPPAALRSG